MSERAAYRAEIENLPRIIINVNPNGALLILRALKNYKPYFKGDQTAVQDIIDFIAAPFAGLPETMKLIDAPIVTKPTTREGGAA